MYHLIAQNIHLRLGNQARDLDHEVIWILVTIVVRYPNRCRFKPGAARSKLDLERGRPPVGCKRHFSSNKSNKRIHKIKEWEEVLMDRISDPLRALE